MPLFRRRNLFQFGLGVVALTMNCSPGYAADRETWRCHAPNADFRQLVLPIDERSSTITGRFIFHKAELSDGANALARIDFKQRGLAGPECNCNGIVALAAKGIDGVQFQVSANGQSAGFIAVAPFETPVAFKISVDQAGVMTAQIGEDHPKLVRVMPHHPERNTLVMLCSGADISYMNIDVR